MRLLTQAVDDDLVHCFWSRVCFRALGHETKNKKYRSMSGEIVGDVPTRRAPTPTELVVLVAFVAFVAAPLATELVLAQQSLPWSLCTLVLSAAWHLLATVLFLWTPVVFCVAALVVCF